MLTIEGTVPIVQTEHPTRAATSDPQSVTNSQSSSLNESTTSHPSQIEPSSLSTSQSSIDHVPLRQTTPSSSLDLTHDSSPPTVRHDGAQQDPISPGARLHDQLKAALPNLDVHDPSNSSSSATTAHGQKRNSSGEVKARPELTITPPEAPQAGHNRQLSATSTGSQIGEVSPPTASYSTICLQHS